MSFVPATVRRRFQWLKGLGHWRGAVGRSPRSSKQQPTACGSPSAGRGRPVGSTKMTSARDMVLRACASQVMAPVSVEPCLTRPAKEPPSGPDWIHEIKHDGFRILARLFTRKATTSPSVSPLIAKLVAPQAVTAGKRC